MMIHSRAWTAAHAAQVEVVPGSQYSFTDLAQIVSRMKISPSVSESGDGNLSVGSKEEEDVDIGICDLQDDIMEEDMD